MNIKYSYIITFFNKNKKRLVFTNLLIKIYRKIGLHLLDSAPAKMYYHFFLA